MHDIYTQNAKQLPTATFAERQQQAAELRVQFPVSSGTVHKDKEAEWVPVEKPDPPPPNPTAQVKSTGALLEEWSLQVRRRSRQYFDPIRNLNFE